MVFFDLALMDMRSHTEKTPGREVNPAKGARDTRKNPKKMYFHGFTFCLAMSAGQYCSSFLDPIYPNLQWILTLEWQLHSCNACVSTCIHKIPHSYDTIQDLNSFKKNEMHSLHGFQVCKVC